MKDAMKTRRVYFDYWGHGTDELSMPRFALAEEYEHDIEAVARSIARKTRLSVCAGPRSEGTALESGRWRASHWAITLGRPCRGGGYTPVAEVWLAIPKNAPEE